MSKTNKAFERHIRRDRDLQLFSPLRLASLPNGRLNQLSQRARKDELC